MTFVASFQLLSGRVGVKMCALLLKVTSFPEGEQREPGRHELTKCVHILTPTILFLVILLL